MSETIVHDRTINNSLKKLDYDWMDFTYLGTAESSAIFLRNIVSLGVWQRGVT